MAMIDGLLLGGRPASEGDIDCGAAIAYRLREPCQLSVIEDIDGWTVESVAGKSTIVARASQMLDRQEAIASGTESIQRCLDLMSFEKFKISELAEVGDGHVLLYADGERRILEIMATVDLTMGFSATAIAYDREGNPLPMPPAPAAVWTPALRFYRLSQASGDLYEAYRNLWLGLEALLSTISSKRPKERERDWLHRVLSTVFDKVDLKQLLPDLHQDPVDYMLTAQYERMRCYLFHAKPKEGMAAPTLPDPRALSIAYAQLIRIWRGIAQHFIGVRQGAGGAVTYVGFRKLLFGPFSTGLIIVYSDASSPVTKADTKINPDGAARVEMANASYQDGAMPGLVEVSASLQIERHRSLPELRRFGCEIGEERALFCVGMVEGGLVLSGIDQLDLLPIFRLKNTSSPKVSF